MKKTLLATSVALALIAPAMAFEAVSTDPTATMSSEIANIQNRCIVRLNDNLASYEVNSHAQGLLNRANAMTQSLNSGSSITVKLAEIQHVYAHSIKGFTLSMPCSAAEKAFGDDANVKSFSPDSIVSISKGKPGGGGGGSASQTTPWSVTRVGGPLNGAGHTAWIIDTGVDLTNADLNVDTSRGFSAFTRGRNAGMNDLNGHGTHVSGTIAAKDNSIDVVGIAAGATVVPVKVLDSRGSGSNSGVIAGVDWVAAHASPGDCANMSLGGGVSQALDDAVKAAAQSSGAYFTLAAGNEGGDANDHSPARANGNNIATISAVDVNDNMPSWSNWGNPPVDYAAPGVSILSLKPGGGTTTMSGTSMASPAACAVRMMTNDRASTSGTAGNDPDGNPDPIIHL